MDFPHDALIVTPGDIDLARSPLRRGIAEPTYVLGAFNPGLMRLPSGNLLLMVRIAEALADPVEGGDVRAIRWTPDGYLLDRHPLAGLDMADPRQFAIRNGASRLMGLTSLSWLLPVELTADGRKVLAVHYDRAIEPAASYAAYGVEDPRISEVDGTWYMTACVVSPERHGTALYTSSDGVAWQERGLVLDHQNKDMVLFEGRVGGRFVALTRPLGEVWFTYPPDSPWAGGPAIHLAASPDALHWKPLDRPGLRARVGGPITGRLGGGTPPVLTDEGWLTLFHGVERTESVGIYRTYWALLDRDDPSHVLHQADDRPLIEANAVLTEPLGERLYLPSPVVFSTGLVDAGDHYVVASGEADLACRITHVPKSCFARKGTASRAPGLDRQNQGGNIA